MEWILTVDVGTTAMKTAVFDENLCCLGMENKEYELEHPRNGWMELDAGVYPERMLASMKTLLDRLPGSRSRIGAICLTSQGETLVFVDESGIPLHPAIIWLDSRAEAEAAELTALLPNDRFYRITGMPENNASMPAAKVKWFASHHPEAFARTNMVLLLVDWLAYGLCGRAISDEAIQTSTGWFDINRRDWWPEMLTAVGLQAAKLPEVFPCGTAAATLLPSVAVELGLRNDVRIVPCGMDQVSSAIGGGNFHPGVVCETTGTALVLSASVNAPDYERPERISFLAHVNGLYLMLPYCPTAGMLLKWFRREFMDREEREAIETGATVYALLDRLAEGGSGYGKGLFLLPDFEGKLTPEPNPAACGVLFGLTLGTTRADMARAMLESVGFMLRENLAMLSAYGLEISEIHSLGGGAKSALWNRIKADILQMPLVPGNFIESTSLGAAMLGQVAIGGFPDLDAAYLAASGHDKKSSQATKEHRGDMVEPAGTSGIVYPNRDKQAGANQAFESYQAIYASLKHVFPLVRKT